MMCVCGFNLRKDMYAKYIMLLFLKELSLSKFKASQYRGVDCIISAYGKTLDQESEFDRKMEDTKTFLKGIIWSKHLLSKVILSALPESL